jgi:hypothetical protein
MPWKTDGVKDDVAGDAEVLAVDLGRGGEAGAPATSWIANIPS